MSPGWKMAGRRPVQGCLGRASWTPSPQVLNPSRAVGDARCRQPIARVVTGLQSASWHPSGPGFGWTGKAGVGAALGLKR